MLSYLLLIIALSLLGLLVLWYGYRSRRMGDTPHCPRCDYILTGLAGQRCPECGTDFTPDTIIYGERRRRHILIVMGIMLLIGAAVCLYLGGRQVNWYLFKPAAWVLNDLQSSDQQLANRAFIELRRRDRKNSLSLSAHEQFLGCCLAAQAVKPPVPFDGDKIEYLTECLLADRLSAKQKNRFFEQSVLLELKVRPRVIQGEDVPILIQETSRIPVGELYINMKGRQRFVIDNQSSEQWISPSGSFCGAGGGSDGTKLKGIGSGQHTLQITVPYGLYRGSIGKLKQSELLYEGQVPLKASFEVLASEPPDYFKRIDDP